LNPRGWPYLGWPCGLDSWFLVRYINPREIPRSEEGRFDDAHAHAEHAKSHTIDNAYNLTLAMELQVVIWYRERRLEEARSEALCAADVCEKLGAAEATEACGKLAQRIQEELDSPVASGRSVLNCELS